MGIKMIVFDIDGTLARTEECIPAHVGEHLRTLENSGARIVLISGRTASYLAGLARGMGIKNPLVAGENGGVIFDPIVFQEYNLKSIPYEVIQELKEIILDQFSDIWFQPNQTMLTAAPHDRSKIEQLYLTMAQSDPVQTYHYKLNKYDDAVEVMPKENSKGKALAVIKERNNIQKEEVIAIGNTIVDMPMRPEAGEFLIIGDGVQEDGVRNYACIEDAFDYLERKLLSSGLN